MHVLDAPEQFSERAQGFLRRAARREESRPGRMPTEFLSARDSTGELVAPSWELVIRREGFAARLEGLTYQVRRSTVIGAVRYDVSRRWSFGLGDQLWPDPRGGYCDWFGEHVSSPIRWLLHADDRIGGSDGGPFLPVHRSVDEMIESHAVMDSVAEWTPFPIGSTVLDLSRIPGLDEVPEASGPWSRWLLSDCVAVREYRGLSSATPRSRGRWVWALGDEGQRRVAEAASADSVDTRSGRPELW